MNRKYLFFSLLVFMMLASVITISTADTAERSGSFTTAKGTIVLVNATMEHDGLDTETSKPTLAVNHTYVLRINVTLQTLGAEVVDFHDISFEIKLSATSLLGSVGTTSISVFGTNISVSLFLFFLNLTMLTSLYYILKQRNLLNALLNL